MFMWICIKSIQYTEIFCVVKAPKNSPVTHGLKLKNVSNTISSVLIYYYPRATLYIFRTILNLLFRKPHPNLSSSDSPHFICRVTHKIK